MSDHFLCRRVEVRHITRQTRPRSERPTSGRPRSPNPTWVDVALDAKINAFNSIHRRTFLKVIGERFPSLWNWVWSNYGEPTELYVRRDNLQPGSAGGLGRSMPRWPIRDWTRQRTGWSPRAKSWAPRGQPCLVPDRLRMISGVPRPRSPTLSTHARGRVPSAAPAGLAKSACPQPNGAPWPAQVGVACSSGLEFTTHSVRAVLDENPTWVDVALDAKNAFNSIHQ